MHDQMLVGEPVRLTYADFCALPEDGRRYEILDGDLYMSPSVVPLHQRIGFRLARLIDDHVAKRKLGEVFVAPLDVLLSEHDVVEPDVVYVSRERASIVGAANIRGIPDLLVEVLSPGTAERDRTDKRNIYARCGVPFYWIVDPDQRTLVELQLAGKAYATVAEVPAGGTFGPRLFPELKIQLNELWA
jgi:Uma2 family endonuclease